MEDRWRDEIFGKAGFGRGRFPENEFGKACGAGAGPESTSPRGH
jgi:hypothetical protein